MNKRVYNITVEQDDESGVYYIAKSDIPGLHVEADSFDELREIVSDLAAELIEANTPARTTRQSSRASIKPRMARLKLHTPLNVDLKSAAVG